VKTIYWDKQKSFRHWLFGICVRTDRFHLGMWVTYEKDWHGWAGKFFKWGFALGWVRFSVDWVEFYKHGGRSDWAGR